MTLQIEITFYVLCILLFALRLGLGTARSVLSAGAIRFTLLLAAMRYKLQLKLPVALPLMLSVCFLGALWRASDNGRCPETGRYARIAVVAFYLFLLPICVLAYSRDTGFGETWYRYFISYSVASPCSLVRVASPVSGCAGSRRSVGSATSSSWPIQSVFALAERLGFGAGDLALPGPLYIALMLAVLTCFAFFVKRTLADPIQRYGDAVVRRRGRRLREDAAIGIRQDA